MLQIRNDMKDTYSFERDIVQLFPRIAEMAATSLAVHSWGPELKDYAAHTGAGPEDMVPAATALALFTGMASDSATAAEAYAKAGFDTLKPAARLAVLSKLGLAAMSAFHHFIRESNKAKFVPRQNNRTEDSADRAAHALRSVSGRRRLKLAQQLAERVEKAGGITT